MEIEGYNNDMFNKKYIIKERVGEGAYGVVYKTVKKENDELVAVKKLRTEEHSKVELLREFSILQDLRNHPNIVKLEKVVIMRNTPYFIMEYMDYDLKKYINSLGRTMNNDLMKSYIYQIFNGIAYCHSKQIIHRDLKTNNILLDRCGILKIADWGSAKKLVGEDNHFNIGTNIYMAPEILIKRPYSFEVDIWAIGCIIVEIKTRDHPFYVETKKGILSKICETFGTPDDLPEEFNSIPKHKGKEISDLVHGPDDLNDLVAKCFKFDTKERITAKEALEHNYFEKLDDKIKNHFKFEDNTCSCKEKSINNN